MPPLRYVSICSGIEAASVAWEPLGWKPIGFSEIEPFPCAVLKHHYPSVPNFGDMTTYANWNTNGAIDVVAGGTPCQSFSIAGMRRGLSDPRGNLMLGFLGIVERFQPRFVLWENVPGVLSSNRGRDFGTFLRALELCGYGWAYRTLDAQYCRTRRFPKAVPQRRRRIFVVGYRGTWRGAAKVLFERQSGGRDFEARNETQRTNSTADLDGIANASGKPIANTLTAHDSPTGRHTPLVSATWWDGESIANTLTASSNNQRMPDKGRMQIVCIDRAAMNAGVNAKYAPRIEISGVMSTLTAQGPHAIGNSNGVRRLTPRECERLQGFPDDYTQIPWRNRSASECPDGPRYKALGNSMAVNCMEWIGERINAAAEHGDKWAT